MESTTSTITRRTRATLRTLNTLGYATRYGFAPDLEYGPRAIAELYTHEPEALVESTVFGTCVPAGDERWLITLGRFEGGFLDILQVAVDTSTEVFDPAISELFEGVARVICPTGNDFAAIQRWLARVGRMDLAVIVGQRAEAPQSSAILQFFRREWEELGLVRDEAFNHARLETLFRRAVYEDDPSSSLVLLEAGRTDLLSCIALHTTGALAA